MEENKQVVFLIDDDEFLLDMYALKFRSSGFAVEIARDADSALSKLKEGFKPSVILVDVVMPNKDGFEFLKIIKEENLASGSLIVILSNLGQQTDIEKGAGLGVNEYIVKASYTPSEVVEKVKMLLAEK